jgi:outer membrane protein assembly factor BamB
MPLVADGTVYAVDTRGNVLAVAIEDGRRLWAATIPSDVHGTPLATDELLIVPADDGIIRAFHLDDGIPAWERVLGAPARSSVAGWGDLAFIGTDDGFVHALKAASGHERWSIESGGEVVKAVAIEDGIGYVVAEGGRVTAFDAPSGSVLWSVEFGPGEFSTPAVSEGILYLTHGSVESDEPYEAIALDVRTEQASVAPIERWRWQAPSNDRAFVGAVTADAIYVVSEDHNVYALDPLSGAGQLVLSTSGEIGSLPTVVGDILYVASADNNVYAVDRKTNDLLWTVEVPGSPTSPVASDGRLIVGTDLGWLLSFGPAATTDPD